MNFAFSVPRAGTITSIAAYFSTTLALSLLGTTVTITAQLYSSTTPNNIFTAIPGASVTLAPPLTGVLALGTISNGITTKPEHSGNASNPAVDGIFGNGYRNDAHHYGCRICQCFGVNIV